MSYILIILSGATKNLENKQEQDLKAKSSKTYMAVGLLIGLAISFLVIYFSGL